MSGSPRFDPTINLGNILVAVSMFIALVTGWAANSGRSVENRERLDRMVANFDELEERVRRLETIGSASAGELSTIAEDLRELKSDVKDLINRHAAIDALQSRAGGVP